MKMTPPIESQTEPECVTIQAQTPWGGGAHGRAWAGIGLSLLSPLGLRHNLRRSRTGSATEQGLCESGEQARTSH